MVCGCPALRTEVVDGSEWISNIYVLVIIRDKSAQELWRGKLVIASPTPGLRLAPGVRSATSCCTKLTYPVKSDRWMAIMRTGLIGGLDSSLTFLELTA